MNRKVRIIGLGTDAFQIVDAANNGIRLGFGQNYSQCLLIASQHGWEVVR